MFFISISEKKNYSDYASDLESLRDTKQELISTKIQNIKSKICRAGLDILRHNKVIQMLNLDNNLRWKKVHMSFSVNDEDSLEFSKVFKKGRENLPEVPQTDGLVGVR